MAPPNGAGPPPAAGAGGVKAFCPAACGSQTGVSSTMQPMQFHHTDPASARQRIWSAATTRRSSSLAQGLRTTGRCLRAGGTKRPDRSGRPRARREIWPAASSSTVTPMPGSAAARSPTHCGTMRVLKLGVVAGPRHAGDLAGRSPQRPHSGQSGSAPASCGLRRISAGFWSADLRGAAVKQDDAQFLFELADLVRQRGLGDVSLLRRAGEIEGVGNGIKVTQMAQFHTGFPLLCDRCHRSYRLIFITFTTAVRTLDSGGRNVPTAPAGPFKETEMAQPRSH